MVFAWSLWYYPFIIASAQAFNYDPETVYVYPNPTGSLDSYFGYSVVLGADSKNSLESLIHVGAPRAHSPKPQYSRPGGLYTCKWQGTCLKRTGFLEPDGVDTSNMFLGGSLALDNRAKTLVVCGWKVVKISDRAQIKLPDIPGRCYTLPARHSSVESKNIKKIHPDMTMHPGPVLFGFSVHIIPGSSPLEFEIGAPAYDDGNGKRYQYHENPETLKEFVSEADGHAPYHGYALSSGYYFQKNRRVLAMGAPRGRDLLGNVLFYSDRTNKIKMNNEPLRKRQGQLGEYFGASLASCDLNNDGKDELLVGAPLWSEITRHNMEIPDIGRVYIYTADSMDTFRLLQKLEGSVIKGRFGTVITCLGDIDGDGNTDVAISAPYEDTGVVYVYYGNGTGLREDRVQILSKPYTRGFGISVSEPRDIDNNGFPDIAVGAYLTNNVLVYPSKVVVRLDIYVKKIHIGSVPNEKDKKSILATICTSYEPVIRVSEKVIDLIRNDKRINLTHQINMKRNDQSVIMANRIDREIDLDADTVSPSVCEKFTITLKKISGIVTLTASSKLQFENKPNSNNVMEYRIVADERNASLNTTREFSLSDCNGKRCVSNLTIELSSDLGDGNILVIGSREQIWLVLDVRNHGEDAYDTRTMFYIPRPLMFLSYSYPLGKCIADLTGSDSHTLVECFTEDVLLAGNNRTLSIYLNASKVTPEVGELKIRTNTSTSSEYESNLRNMPSLEITCRLDVKLQMDGKSVREGRYAYSDKTYESISFQHEYKVRQNGKSPIDQAKFIVYVPANFNDIEIIQLKSKTVFVNGSWIGLNCTDVTLPTGGNISTINMLPSEETMIPLSCGRSQVTCKMIQCFLGRFKAESPSIRIRISFETDTTRLSLLVNNNIDTLLFETRAEVNLTKPQVENKDSPGYFFKTSVQTQFTEARPNPQNISLYWIIPVAMIFGILLIALLGFGLYTCGFFKRKRKTNMELVPDDDKSPRIEDVIGDEAADRVNSNGMMTDDEDHRF